MIRHEEDTLVKPVQPDTSTGDHDKFAHWAPKHKVTEAYATGIAILALCGKWWTPSRDPFKFPICPTCEEILGRITGTG